MEVSYVHLVIIVVPLHRTLPEKVTCFIVIFRRILLIEAEQTNMGMILTVIDESSHLFLKALLITAVIDFKLSAPWEHCLLLKHGDPTVHDH